MSVAGAVRYKIIRWPRGLEPALSRAGENVGEVERRGASAEREVRPTLLVVIGSIMRPGARTVRYAPVAVVDSSQNSPCMRAQLAGRGSRGHGDGQGACRREI